MTTLQFTATYSHGLRGLIGAYLLTVLGVGFAYVRRRAGLIELSQLPLRAARLCVVALLALAISSTFLDPFVRWDESGRAWSGALYLLGLGYVGGLWSLHNRQRTFSERGAQLRDTPLRQSPRQPPATCRYPRAASR